MPAKPLSVEVTGWKKARSDFMESERALQPRGAIGRGIRAAGFEAHRIAVSITHVRTSALKHAHRVEFKDGRIPMSRVFVSPIRNPMSNWLTTEYASLEHDRGGDHRFYERVQLDHYKEVGMAFVDNFYRGVPILS